MEERRNERFGRYEVLSELGRGAMGVVYKARDPKINRVVAVKTINLAGQPPEEEQEYRERFLREAEAAGRLSHPGIVTIFDVGEEPDTRSPYIVMEYVGGQTLDKMLASDPDHKLPLDKALQLTLELAEALDCAHGQGVVHRDLKPANILITEEGNAKIADFGVAKLNLANHTLAGRALGTPAFMSPEQLNGEAVDGRSDLFSLGVILYTVLTGYRPFQGNSAMTVSYKVVNRQPLPATVLDTELPPAVDYIVSRAMAKDPANRYQRGMELVLDIQELRAGREPWSKAKQPDAVSSITPLQTERMRPSAPVQPKASNKFRQIRPAPAPNHATPRKILAKMRHSAVTGGVFLLGLAIFGVRIAPLLRLQPAESLSLPMPRTTPLAPQISEAPAISTAPAPRVKAVAAPIVNKPRKSLLIAAARPTSKAVIQPVKTSVDAAPSVPPVMLGVEVEHKFAQASLSIWIDDRLAFTHQLEGVDKKRLGVFHHVEGHEFHAMQISPGKHLLRAQVTSDAPNSPQSATLDGDFGNGSEQILHVQFAKTGEMNLSLQ